MKENGEEEEEEEEEEKKKRQKIGSLRLGGWSG